MESVVTRGVILVILVACLVVPVHAASKYLDGSPDLTAYIGGTNEFSPGHDVRIVVVIVNNGISTDKQSASMITAPADLPATAKFVTVGMAAGDAPLVIKSDQQMIGDLGSRASGTATFNATVYPYAHGGTYKIPVTITYTRLDFNEQFGVDTVRNHYVQDTVTLAIPLVISHEVLPGVMSAVSDHLVAGQEGYLNLTIRNNGSLDGANVTVRLIRNENSPVVPVDSSVYIGDFPAGSTISCRYKLAVEKNALGKTYPVGVEVIYQNREGDVVTSPAETVGVAVGNKVDFAILSPPVVISPGSRETIRVIYKNTGNSLVRSAKARIVPVDPFTSSSDVADLVDIAPGASAFATFQISVTSDATIKTYGLDSEIRFLDIYDNTYISDPLTVAVEVRNLTGITSILSNILDLSIIILVIFVIGVAVLYLRKKRR